MDERALDDLHAQLIARSWLYPDPSSHAAGVNEAVSALRSMLDRRAERTGVRPPVTGRPMGVGRDRHVG